MQYSTSKVLMYRDKDLKTDHCIEEQVCNNTMGDEDANFGEPLRISQLDASELDNELYSIIKQQFRNIFKYFKANWLAFYDPEFSAAVKFILWKYTIYDNGQTIGQKLLNLKYINEIGDKKWMNKKQRTIYGILLIFGPWITERSHTFSQITSGIKYADKMWKFLGGLDLFWKAASLVHFLGFLVQGRYQFLLERFLGIRSIFPNPQGVRQIGFEFMDRELLWHGFAEFLFFALPLINFRRMKNYISRILLPQQKVEGSMERCLADLKECVVCGEWPFNPQEIGCLHVFCYYCIHANYKADPGFSCPLCGKAVERCRNIQPVTVKMSPNMSNIKKQLFI